MWGDHLDFSLSRIYPRRQEIVLLLSGGPLRYRLQPGSHTEEVCWAPRGSLLREDGWWRGGKRREEKGKEK